jgi:hypothetical protein
LAKKKVAEAVEVEFQGLRLRDGEMKYRRKDLKKGRGRQWY